MILYNQAVGAGYATTEQLMAAAGGLTPTETFTEFDEGEIVNLAGWSTVQVYLGAKGENLEFRNKREKENACTFVLKTTKTEEVEIEGANGKRIHHLKKAIEVRELFRPLNVQVPDEGAMARQRAIVDTREDLSASQKALTIASLPVIYRTASLERNEWQLLWLYVWNDVEGVLKDFANDKSKYNAGAQFQHRINRLLAFAGSADVVLYKDKNPDATGAPQYYTVTWLNPVTKTVESYLRSRKYWVLSGKESDLEAILQKAKEANIPTVGRTQFLLSELEAASEDSTSKA